MITFIKASSSSIISALVDLGLFTLISHGSNSLIVISIATIVARVTSTVINFLINKYWAFKSKGSLGKESIYFAILFIVKIALSSLLVWVFNFLPINQTFLKAIIDFILFFFSYVIQKKLIFNR